MATIQRPKSASFAHPSKPDIPAPITVEGEKKGKFREVEAGDKKKEKSAQPDSNLKFSVTLGSKLPIPGIAYSSQEIQVTVSGEDFDEVHSMACDKYGEVLQERREFFEAATRRGNV